MVMEVMQDEVVQPPLPDAIEVVELEPVEAEQEVELRAMGDGSSTSTMQLKGQILSKEVHVLIDSGASHNFVHPAALKTSMHKVVQIKPLRVRLASGAIMYTKGEVNLEIKLQQLTLKANFYVLPVSRCEVVMGASWLKTLGDIVWNFETMIMRFQLQGATYYLKGISTPQASLVSCKSMARLLKKEREAVLVKVQPLTTIEKKQDVHPDCPKPHITISRCFCCPKVSTDFKSP